MTPPKSGIRKWVRALRSGKYRQTRGRLQNKMGYCCLGVLCDITIPKAWQILTPENVMWGCMPSMQPAAPSWVRFIVEDFNDLSDEALTDLNDGTNSATGKKFEPFTFDEIADLLEAVYLLEVLK